MISKFPRCWWRFALLEKEEWLFTFIIMVCLMLKLLKILFYFMDFYMLLNINPLYADKEKYLKKKEIWFENMIQRYILMRGSRIFTEGGGSKDNFVCRRGRGPRPIVSNYTMCKFNTCEVSNWWVWLIIKIVVGIYVISKIILKKKEVLMNKNRNNYIYIFLCLLVECKCMHYYI